MMEAEITRNDLRRLVPKFKKALDQAHLYQAQELWGNVMEFSPVDHGRLAGSWQLIHRSKRESSVLTNVKYALVVNDGSDPYMIYPRRANALRFKIDGEVIYAKEVLHPGIEGTRYIEGAISATQNRTREFVERALEEEGLI